jgi:hypothetical protein
MGNLRPGVDPADVLPAAAAAGTTLTTVEASQVAVTRGEARVTIRFTGEDDELALQIARHIVSVTDVSARVTAWRMTKLTHGEWRLAHSAVPNSADR